MPVFICQKPVKRIARAWRLPKRIAITMRPGICITYTGIQAALVIAQAQQFNR